MSILDGAIATGASHYRGLPTPHDRVADALHASGAKVISKGHGRWRLRNGGLGTGTCDVSLEEEWLTLSKSLTGDSLAAPDLARPLQLLRRNAELPGGVRYALVGDCNDLQLRADIPCRALLAHGQDLLAARIDQALPGFRRASARSPASNRDGGRGADPAASGDDGENDFVSRLLAVCDEAGWRAERGNTDEPRVEVVLGDGCGVATIMQAGTGALFRTYLNFTDLPADDGDCARAIGVLLLRAAGHVRMCRPVLHAREDRPAIQFQVLIGESTMVAAEVDCALGALSVAAKDYMREVELLSTDPHLARLYLDTWKKHRSRTSSTRKM